MLAMQDGKEQSNEIQREGHNMKDKIKPPTFCKPKKQRKAYPQNQIP